MLAMVDLPDPDRPVNHSTTGFWPLALARWDLSTSSACQWMFWLRRNANLIMPTPAVALVSGSIRMKDPLCDWPHTGQKQSRGRAIYYRKRYRSAPACLPAAARNCSTLIRKRGLASVAVTLRPSVFMI